jgi:hypothetical protein
MGGNRPPKPVRNLNRLRLPGWATATGNVRPGRGFRPPLYRYLNRARNRFNRPANRVKGEGPGVARPSRGNTSADVGMVG